jgi:hypothetical protein
MFTKFEMFFDGFASFGAFPAPNPKLVSSTPTLTVASLISALS